METEKISIENLNCGGCVRTITNKLTAMEGVESVEVELETSIVTVKCGEEINRADLTEKLLSIGYPESAVSNGLFTKIKGIESCIIGKITNLKK